MKAKKGIPPTYKKESQLMIDEAIKSEPLAFKGFDRTKNVQDQLQEMVEVAVSSEPQYKVMSQFVRFFAHYEWIPPHFTTWEQLWLAFVMHERFGKRWTGSRWVKET